MHRGVSEGGVARKFTEAVPLSLSSMAHANLQLQGVLDGLKQVLQHTMLQCVNYARIIHPPHQWSFRDLGTSPFAWTPIKSMSLQDLPFSLTRMDLRFQYARHAGIYLKPAMMEEMDFEKEQVMLQDWTNHAGILGKVSLYYATAESLTPGELNGSETEDVPFSILYKIVVEYRSLPPTGNQQAVQAEELSMLSFGGSVDDDVKYGALASLYDEHAKYVLKILSVRGKKYMFDLMDSTLSNGDIPRLPISREGDPFIKSLCLTVSDHHEDEHNSENCAITRMELMLEGKLRNHSSGLQACLNDLPEFNYMTNGIMSSFLHLNPIPPAMVAASPSGHTLLLDPQLAGHIYVNGRYVTTWGEDPRIGSHGIALFGMDLHSVPFWQGRIVDYEVMKVAYAELWHEVLVDARLSSLGIARRLLYRLMKGVDPPEAEDEDDLYDIDEEDDTVDPSVHQECLESLVLSASQYDVVGIAPKALATRFATEFGRSAFPCRAHETEWVRQALPDRQPTVVPQRLINILRRGGYFDTQKTADLLWFEEGRPANEKGIEQDIVLTALQFLEVAECHDVLPEHIQFVASRVADNVITRDAVCRRDPSSFEYFVQEDFLSVNAAEFLSEDMQNVTPTRIKGYLLGMYIAKEHPNGKVLARYIVRNSLS